MPTATGDLAYTPFNHQHPFPPDLRMQRDTLNDRDVISAPIRWEGMLVYVLENQTTYQLRGGLTNEYWAVFVGGEGGDVSNAVLYTIQSLTPAQQLQARLNIGAGELMDGLISLGPVTSLVNDVTIDSVLARINGTNVGTNDPTTINVPVPTEGYTRRDLIVIDGSGLIYLVQGTEVLESQTAITPNVPDDTVVLVETFSNDTGLQDVYDFAYSQFVRFDVNNQGLSPLQRLNARTNIQSVSKDTDDIRTGSLRQEGLLTVIGDYRQEVQNGTSSTNAWGFVNPLGGGASFRRSGGLTVVSMGDSMTDYLIFRGFDNTGTEVFRVRQGGVTKGGDAVNPDDFVTLGQATNLFGGGTSEFTEMSGDDFFIGYRVDGSERIEQIFEKNDKDVIVTDTGNIILNPTTQVANFIFTGTDVSGVTELRGIETALDGREIHLTNRTGADFLIIDNYVGGPLNTAFNFGGTDYTFANGETISFIGDGTVWNPSVVNEIAFSDNLDSVNAKFSIGTDGLETISGIQEKNTGANLTYKEINYVPEIIDGVLFVSLRGKTFAMDTPNGIDSRFFGVKADGVTDDSDAYQSCLNVIPTGSTLLIPVGTSIISPTVETEYILEIMRSDIHIKGISRTGSIIKIADGAGNYWGIFGSRVIDAVKWTADNFTIDHNQAGNPLTDAQYTSRLRYSISCYPKIADTIYLNNIDIVNCDSIVSFYFPQTTIRSKVISITNCRWLDASTQHSVGDYDQSFINAAGDLGIIQNNIFQGLTWEKAPRTGIETHFSKNVISGNIFDKFQVMMNITGLSRPGIDYATNIYGNAGSASRLGIVAWSMEQSDTPSVTGLGLCGINISDNTINMRTDLYPVAYDAPRGAAIQTWNSPLNLNSVGIKICDNNITYGDGINVPALTSVSPTYMAAIAVTNSSKMDTEMDLLDISNNTVHNSPFAALLVDFGIIKSFNSNNNNFLDCCINSVGGASTARGAVVVLNAAFVDSPAITGGKITFHKDTTCNDVIYYRDRSTTPKTLTIDTQIDIYSSNSSSLVRYVGVHTATGATVLFKSVLNGTLKTMPLGAVVGSKCTHNGIILKRTINQWISEFYTESTPTTGTHSTGSRAWNNTPAPGEPIGWVCSATGTPGSWVPFGAVGTDTDFNELYFKASHITTAYDLNTVTNGFVARSSTSNFTNAPKASGPWLVQDIAAPGINVQTAWLLTSDEVYTRRYYASTWNAWVRLDTPDSDSITKGKIELATQLEVNTGTDTVRAVTPETLQGKINSIILSSSHVLDFPVIASDANTTLSTTVTGAALGDIVSVAGPADIYSAGGRIDAWVSFADTVTVRVKNDGGSSIDPASGTFNIKVFK